MAPATNSRILHPQPTARVDISPVRASSESPADDADRPSAGRPPDFLVIGAQKAGTTWLHRNLSEHPQLWLPPVKELHYLNQKFRPSAEGWEWAYRRRTVEGIRRKLQNEPEPGTDIERERRRSRTAALALCERRELDERSYLAIFANADPAAVCGESTPEYSILPSEAVDDITRLNPDLRVVFILRDPVARAVSHIRMLHGYGEIRSPSDGVDDMYIEGAVARSDYGPVIERWRSRLTSGSLHLAAYEDIAADPGRFLGNICTFLGVRADPSLFPNRDKVVFRGEEFTVHPEVLRTLGARLSHVPSDVRRLAPAIAARWTAS